MSLRPDSDPGASLCPALPAKGVQRRKSPLGKRISFLVGQCPVSMTQHHADPNALVPRLDTLARINIKQPNPLGKPIRSVAQRSFNLGIRHPHRHHDCEIAPNSREMR